MDNTKESCYTEDVDMSAPLSLADDYVFCRVMQDKRACIETLELILDTRIRDIKYTQRQKIFDSSFDGKGIRVDVYLDDGKDTVYDLEMQTTSSSALPLRSRYYQSSIDQSLLSAGDDYSLLKHSVIIFICTFDPFSRGLAKYTFRERADEALDVVLNDKTRRIFVNTKANSGSSRMMRFFDFINKGCADRDDPYILHLQKCVEDASKDKEWRRDYMLMKTKFRFDLLDAAESGRKEGCEIGRKDERTQLLRNFLSNGGTESDAIKLLNVTQEEIDTVLQKK